MSKKIILSPKEVEKTKQAALNQLKAAKVLLEKDLYRSSISSSYYAIYSLITILLAQNNQITKTHSGLKTKFNQLFIKTNKLPKRYSILLSTLQEKRQIADYEAIEDISQKQAKDIYQSSKDFANKLLELI